MLRLKSIYVTDAFGNLQSHLPKRAAHESNEAKERFKIGGFFKGKLVPDCRSGVLLLLISFFLIFLLYYVTCYLPDDDEAMVPTAAMNTFGTMADDDDDGKRDLLLASNVVSSF